jgi:hypothetical protein
LIGQDFVQGGNFFGHKLLTIQSIGRPGHLNLTA